MRRATRKHRAKSGPRRANKSASSSDANDGIARSFAVPGAIRKSSSRRDPEEQVYRRNLPITCLEMDFGLADDAENAPMV
jgi:hypothetical protein